MLRSKDLAQNQFSMLVMQECRNFAGSLQPGTAELYTYGEISQGPAN